MNDECRMIWTHSMCQEGNKEEDSLALKIALINQNKDSGTTLKRDKINCSSHHSICTINTEIKTTNKEMKRKRTEWIVQERNWRDCTGKDTIWLKKGNHKSETEPLLIAAENNAIRTNYIKAKIDKRQLNSKYWLCGKIKRFITL